MIIHGFYFRLVVSSLEALENCFAVGSSCEKVSVQMLFFEHFNVYILNVILLVFLVVIRFFGG